MKVVILAGGKGTRLKPYTTSFPKPLVPVGDKPILEWIIRDLVKYGFNEVIISVGHLAPLIQSYFGDGSKLGARIEYSLEDKPLGTIGPLTLVRDKLYEPFFLINGDVLTDVNYRMMAGGHIDNNAFATIAVNRREIDVEFGVADFEGGWRIKKYTEKPKIEYWVGMGVCIFHPDIFTFIEKDTRVDLPDLLGKLISKKYIQAYPHDGYWFDIGRPKDYEMACEFVGDGVGWN